MSPFFDIGIRGQNDLSPKPLSEWMNGNYPKDHPQLDFAVLLVEGQEQTWPLGNTLWTAMQFEKAAEQLSNNHPCYIRSVVQVKDLIGNYLHFIPQEESVEIYEVALISKSKMTPDLDQLMEAGNDPDSFPYYRYSNYYRTLAIETGYYDHHFAVQLYDFLNEEGKRMTPQSPTFTSVKVNKGKLIEALRKQGELGKRCYAHFGIEHLFH